MIIYIYIYIERERERERGKMHWGLLNFRVVTLTPPILLFLPI